MKRFRMKEFIALSISIILLSQVCWQPAYAVNNTKANSETEAENTAMDISSAGSVFTLANSNIQISDDYLPKSTYISEIENPEFQEDNGYVLEIAHREYPAGLVLSETQGDPMVYLTQKWLNQEYGSVPGFGSVIEDGRTGWDTIYGLTRALQHELGITDLADNFGPSTQKLYSENPLRRQDGVTNRKFAILQGALWCKGYSPGYYLHENVDGTVEFDEVFNGDVERAVIELKQDAGLINPDGIVTTNVMESLMSMDSFKLLSSYGGDEVVRAMQQKLNRKYEAYTGLTPCDGVYGRNTNMAIVYALQAEEGLPADVANGNFGDTTKRCCPQIPYAINSTASKDYNASYYTSNRISAMTELVQFALYVNGFGSGQINGEFDETTRQAICAFQEKHAIPVTGVADRVTWLSLFISCGDIARSALAADCATILTTEKAKSLYNNGYRYIGRYLTGTMAGGVPKNLTRKEAEIILDAGLNFFPIFQTEGYYNSYFTQEQGRADAYEAIDAATKLGIPAGTIIYFAVDYDCMDYQITDNVIPYFEAVNYVMSDSIYQTGIYGTRNACTRVSELGYATSSFVGDMSTGFSGNLGYSMPNNWAFDQFYTTDIGSGAGYLEIDKDGFSGKDHGVSYLDASAEKRDPPPFTSGSTESDVLNGPVLNLFGKEVQLFKMDLFFDKNLLDGLVTSKYNKKDGTTEIIIGLLNVPEDPAVKTAEYREIKKLYKAFGQDTSRETWNDFQKMRSKLAKKKMKFGFEFDGQLVAFLKVKETKPGLKIVEGGMLLVGDTKASVSTPLIPPTLFLKFEIEGSTETGLSFQLTDMGEITPKGVIKFSLTPKLGVELNIAANAYGGFSGKLDCSAKIPAATPVECFEAYLNGSLFLEVDLLLWEGAWSLSFCDMKLYPEEDQPKILSLSSDDLDFIQPVKKEPTPYSINAAGIFSANMPIYCAPKIISLGNGKMLMTYIDDSQTRSAENRNILMYSVSDGTTWSSPTAVLDDGTGDFTPEVYPDGIGGAHIIWQNAKHVFPEGSSMNDVATNMELYYTHWDGTDFIDTVALTNNSEYEYGHHITANKDSISVVWQQNSENDPMSEKGTNNIYRKQFSNATWGDVETIASNLAFINSIDTAYSGSQNVIAYIAKTTRDMTTTHDLEVFYYDDSTKQLTSNNGPEYCVTLIGNRAYWLSGDTVWSATGGDATSLLPQLTGISTNVSDMKVIENNGEQPALIWHEEDNGSERFYCSLYNNMAESFGEKTPISEGDDFIRGWDACILLDNQIELSYCKANKAENTQGNKPYGQIDLVEKPASQFYDITVGSIVPLTDAIVPGSEITLTADVYNSGSKPVEQFDVTLSDVNGNLIHSAVVDQELAVGQECVLNFPYTLPSTIVKMDYTAKITPHSEKDVRPSDNCAIFTIGYPDVAIKEIRDVNTDATRRVEITIGNQGYDTIDSAVLKISEREINGKILFSNQITQLAPGEEVNIAYNIPPDILNPLGSFEPTVLQCSIESVSKESDYGNNNKDFYLYSDCTITLTNSTGGTIIGTGNYAYGSLATVTATPDPNYIFGGWYENGKLLDAVNEEYAFVALRNRSLEARFIPNNLAITDIDVFGSLQTGQTLTFTPMADGGVHPYNWEFSIYNDKILCYHRDEGAINFFEWTPIDPGTYSVVANVTDTSGFKKSYTKTFIIS